MRTQMMIVIATVLAVGAAHAHADPATAAAGALVQKQFAEWTATLANGPGAASAVFAPGAKLAATGGLGVQEEVVPAIVASELFGNDKLSADVTDVRVGTATDALSEWVYFTATVKRISGAGPRKPEQVRGSELISKHGDHWLVDGGMLSIGNADGPVNAGAKAGTLLPLQPIADAADGDKDVLAAFTDLIAKGFDDASAARKDLIAVGSGPGELTNGGKGIAPYFKKAWAGHATISGPMLAVTSPSKTTASVLANVNLPGGTKAAPYQLPFRLFVVFQKTPAGAWSPVHVHFAVAAPRDTN